jgi:hypothetical protein
VIHRQLQGAREQAKQKYQQELYTYQVRAWCLSLRFLRSLHVLCVSSLPQATFSARGRVEQEKMLEWQRMEEARKVRLQVAQRDARVTYLKMDAITEKRALLELRAKVR